MKIEWLNEELTKARLTKGWFRKRTTVVTLTGSGYASYWAFVNDERCPDDLVRWIEMHQRLETRRRKHQKVEAAWVELPRLPPARIIER